MAAVVVLSGVDYLLVIRPIETRREVASEWEYLADRIPVVRAVLDECDWATERDALPA